jgi:DNA invertase Pin-like site-specific DNA recombinase
MHKLPMHRLMLTILGGLADFESDLIRTRTSPPISAAVHRHVVKGLKLLLRFGLVGQSRPHTCPRIPR